MSTIGVALIGCGGIALQNHLPGLALCPQAKLTAICDANPDVLERAKASTGVQAASTDFAQVIARDDVHAVIVATPNVTHHQIVLAALAARKHVLCEKPLGMNTDQTRQMLQAAQDAGVRHMTAFTYRFVPAMRYIAHLVQQGAIGRPYHFRAQRFQDWGDRFLAWRQIKAQAATGELGDMLSHRIDFAHFLVGPIQRLVARLKQFVPLRGGQPSDLDDWVSILADFENGATGVWESSKLTTGRGEGPRSPDICEVNGDAGTLVYHVGTPNQILIGRKGDSAISQIPVPDEFLKVPGSPRDPRTGDPLITFRYDQAFEFITAIAENRDCSPSFAQGLQTQQVIDAALQSDREGKWIAL